MPILSAISSLQPRRFRARQTPRTPHETHQTSHPRLRMRGSTRPRKASRCQPCWQLPPESADPPSQPCCHAYGALPEVRQSSPPPTPRCTREVLRLLLRLRRTYCCLLYTSDAADD